jgi:hypothetical protein
VQIEKSIILLKNLARHAMERAFKAQNLVRHEPECLIGCAANVYFVNEQNLLPKIALKFFLKNKLLNSSLSAYTKYHSSDTTLLAVHDPV